MRAGGTVFAIAILVTLAGILHTSGAPVLGTGATVAGLALLLFRANAVLERGRVRRGGSTSFAPSLTDLGALTARDSAEFFLVTFVGAALFIAGAVTAGGGA